MRAREITAALGGRWRGEHGIARCPAHDDKNPSLTIRDGKINVLLTCFAGCDRRDIVAELRRRGLMEANDQREVRPRREPAPEPEHEPDHDALRIWHEAKAPAPDSAVWQYLHRERGLTLDIPPTIRAGTTLHLDRIVMPIMVAAVQRPDGKLVSVQTTILTLAGKKAAVSLPRKTTGALGCGAVRLGAACAVMGLAEGVETALAAIELTGITCWASLGATRMWRVAIPDVCREVHIFADDDEAGRAAAERTAHAHRQAGRRVHIRVPQDGCNDWSDVLTIRRAAA